MRGRRLPFGDLLCSVVPSNIRDGLELVGQARHCNRDDGEILVSESLVHGGFKIKGIRAYQAIEEAGEAQ